MSDDLEDLYIEFAELTHQINDTTRDFKNKKKALDKIKDNFNTPESDGSFAIEFSDHAFKQISTRLEELMSENEMANKDILRSDNKSDSLILPSNLESFIITLLATSRKNKNFKKQKSKSGGTEYHIFSDIKRWSSDKVLQFVGIVENNTLKTGFFNWV